MQDHRKNIRIKQVLFGLAILLLAAPMIQQNFKLFKVSRIWGAYNDAVKPDLNSHKWFSGQYQDDLQKYVDQKIGFHSFFIKSYNQVYFSVFNQARANGVIIGKDNYLYEKMYIDAMMGKDFIGEEKIKKKVEKIELLSDSLKKKGIPLIVLLAPGKGTFFPDFIPDKYRQHIIGRTNYDTFKESLSKSSVLFLDFQDWFLKMKDTASYPLFPKSGIHWSQYGEYLVIDSVLAFIKEKHEGYTPEINFIGIETNKKAKGRDADIELAMNLLYKNEDLEMAYPKYDFIQPQPKDSIKILTVADSYFNYLFKKVMNTNNVFRGSQFWYYNRTVYDESSKGEVKVKDLNIANEVLNSDVVILLATDANLYRFPFGFEDDLYSSLFLKNKRLNQFITAIQNSETNSEKVADFASKKNKSYNDALFEIANGLLEYERTFIRNNKIVAFEEKIKSDENWLQSIKKKASANNISLEKAINADAKYMVSMEINKASDSGKDYLSYSAGNDFLVSDSEYLNQLLDFYIRVNDYKHKINASPNWLKSVRKKAEKDNISLEKAIIRDAEYMVREDYRKSGISSRF